MDPVFQSLIDIIRKLPGIGPRHATRIILSLIDKPQPELNELADAIRDLKQRVQQCSECFNLSSDGLCLVCRDRRRDSRSILVVEKVTDVESLERARVWQGLYHVLGGAISPIDGVGPEHLRLNELVARIDRYLPEVGSLEIVLATNPTASGEMTAKYIRNYLMKIPGIRITRLARGLATGTHLEYADEITLKYALDQRK